MDFVTGGRVSARGLPWDVIEIAQVGAQQRLRLRCASGDLRGLEWDILYPYETVEILQSALRPEASGTLAAWRLHHMACLLEQVLESDEMLATEPGRVTIEPYQIVPLLRALDMRRPRLLLADGVGLGKTIQAGLIATELIARRRAHRILVVSPAGPLLTQWQQELRQRFGLRFTAIADAAALQRERRGIELGGNPFDSVALCLVSLDFAKQERVLEDLERSSWDLAIIDEAHHCIGDSAGTDRDDTLRRRLAEVIARRCDGLLLLTATPHDGYDAHFASLIELLDPSLVDGRGGLAGMAYRRHVVRRLKSHIRNPVTGEAMFRERRVTPVRIELRGASAVPVQAFHTALAALVAPRLRRAKRIGDYADALAFIGLLKRSVSTVAACVNTLNVVAERYRLLRANGNDAEALRKERARALRAWRRRRLRFGVLDAAAESNAAALEVEDMAADLRSFAAGDPVVATPLARSIAPPGEADPTLDALDHLLVLGAAAAGEFDPKLNAMLDEVRLIRAAHPLTNILIYTEYVDSQLAALQALRDARGIAGEVLAISGTDPEPERIRAAERCAEHDGIILVSTDSMAEGLNLQQRCFHLIHLDLPYNPNRLEQRNGRIDRYGQAHDPEIRYLYLGGTFEERLLLRLIAKYEKARACLAVMPDTLGATADASTWSKGLVAGFAEDQAALFEADVPTIRTLDQVAEAGNAAALRDLLHEIDRAFAGHERHSVRHGWLVEQGLNADLGQTAAAAAARRHGDTLLGHIDLAGFVVAAIEAATGVPADPDRLQLPADWTAGLEDLPGYDPLTRTLRITRDREQLRDAQGASLAFLGRAHPLVRRAVSRMRQNDIAEAADPHDCRVSAARCDSDAFAVLLSFAVEIAGARGVELQRVIAVLLPECGPPVELAEPQCWLRLATADRAIATAGLWQRRFASWVAKRQAQAEQIAIAAMHRMATEFGNAQRERAGREATDLQRWLRLRADDICGVHMPRTADLFGLVPILPAWKSLPEPIDRLAAFTADAANPPAKRREANSVVTLFRRRAEESDSRATVSPPRLRPIGMLLLVPDGAGA